MMKQKKAILIRLLAAWSPSFLRRDTKRKALNHFARTSSRQATNAKSNYNGCSASEERLQYTFISVRK